VELNLKLSELLFFLKNVGIDYKKTEVEDKPDIVIKGFSSIYDTQKNTLSWMTTQLLNWASIHASAIICSANAELPKNTGIVFIPVENPKNAFALVLREYCHNNAPVGISQTAQFGENCEIGKNVYIGHHVVVGNHVKIGDHTHIHSNAIIHDHVLIGSNCVIHSGVVIGTDGFGYERDLDGTSFKIPHIGGVIIEDDVEIGSNSCVARGVLSNTVISKNTKIGNLSHISHNVFIGANTMITHLAHIGGSLTIEENCWIAPGSVYMQGLTVGRNSLTGLGAVVIRDVKPFDVVAGVPAKTIKKIKTDE
jgi:UDP-3-O-[3-hydroxymyristoyl] glucosamine N-acyltransferase